MSTTIDTQRGITPTDDQIDEYRLALIEAHDRYAFATGYLGGILGSLADHHTRCRKPHCWQCWHLRRGLAFLAALDHPTPPTAGGTR